MNVNMYRHILHFYPDSSNADVSNDIYRYFLDIQRGLKKLSVKAEWIYSSYSSDNI